MEHIPALFRNPAAADNPQRSPAGKSAASE